MNDYVTGTGQIIGHVHEPDAQCLGGCVIHNPSDHPMRDFATHWRTFDGLIDIKPSHMERICPHGIGHPDPDSVVFFAKKHGIPSADVLMIHGCDGCCAGSYDRYQALKEI